MSVIMKQELWKQFGISEQCWNCLAEIVEECDSKGIKLYCLSKLNYPGVELLFESYSTGAFPHPIVLNVSATGDSRVEFYRHYDHGPESVRRTGDVNANYKEIGRYITLLR